MFESGCERVGYDGEGLFDYVLHRAGGRKCLTERGLGLVSIGVCGGERLGIWGWRVEMRARGVGVMIEDGRRGVKLRGYRVRM